jgi:hypothetical protein
MYGEADHGLCTIKSQILKCTQDYDVALKNSQ